MEGELEEGGEGGAMGVRGKEWRIEDKEGRKEGRKERRKRTEEICNKIA